MNRTKLIAGGIVAALALITLIIILSTDVLIGPMMVEVNEEIGSNETAFLLPLEEKAAEGGKAIGSVEDLEKAVVRSQRVIIPQRQFQTGRLPGSYKWIPTMRVVKVDRTQVTREWTRNEKTGTSTADQAIKLESLDSIDFQVGMTVGVSILHEDAPKFLYYNAGRKLSDIVDSNIRGFCQSVLAREFGKALLSECPARKGDAFKTCFEEAKTFYKQKGITIDYLGSSEGLYYSNSEIQRQFDRQFTASNEAKVAEYEKKAQDEKNAIELSKRRGMAQAEIETAKQQRLIQDEKNELLIAKRKAEAQAEIEGATLELKAQEVRNTTLVAKAKAEREAAEEMAKAKEGVLVRTEMEVRKMQAEAQLEFAKNWKGGFPTYLPQGATYLFGLEQFLPQNPAAVPAKK
jgi:hypothetical protein